MTFAPEFSRILAIEGIIPDKTREENLSATEEECAALAQRFDIRGISDLKARIFIRRVAGGEVVRVWGQLEADIVQACVVSLQDVHDRIESSFETFFTEKDTGISDDEDVEISEDAPEMAANGIVDLGEVVAQYLSLELNPYPRAPGVSLAAQMAEHGLTQKNNPFSVLENLRNDEKSDKKKLIFRRFFKLFAPLFPCFHGDETP